MSLRHAQEVVMSVGIGRISKGLFQEAIEKVANNKNDNKKRSDLLRALKAKNPTAWFNCLEDSGALESASADYVRNRWCKFWEPAYKAEDVEAIIRQSLLEALELAERLRKDLKRFTPIDCHWIWTNDTQTLEVLITYNEWQVTRILLTPPPPTNPRLSLSGLAPYFIVKLRSRIDEKQEQVLEEQADTVQAAKSVGDEHPINRHRRRLSGTTAMPTFDEPDHPIRSYRALKREKGAPWVTVQIKAQR
jgi:hypothetical protein